MALGTVLDPTAARADDNASPGPDAGLLIGKRIGFRLDRMWRAWDWISDLWADKFRAAGAEVRFWRSAGRSGEEGERCEKEYQAFLESIDVAVVGLLVARRLFHDNGRLSGRRKRTFNGIDDALVRLGVGLLLHDIGKLAVPKEILQKPGPLDVDEWEVLKRHPQLGLELLTTDLIGYHAKAVVRSHHERWDGLGYPDGRRGDDIAQFARIASVADVYDEITSDRPSRAAVSPAIGYSRILDGAGSEFDPEVVDVFRRVVAPYPTGTEVMLSDGRRGVVSEVPPWSVHRPVVRIFTDRNGRRVEPVEVQLEDHPDIDLAPPAAA